MKKPKKILFISRAKKNGNPSNVVMNQAASLRKNGLEIDFFLVKTGGFKGYFSSIKKLKTLRKETNYDVFHAHYSLCGIIASLSGIKNLVVSLMGSDVLDVSSLQRRIIKFFVKIIWAGTIVKSEQMFEKLNVKSVKIIPNGVDTKTYRPLDNIKSKNKLSLDAKKKYILFVGDPNRKEKNFTLANEILKKIASSDVDLLLANEVPRELMPYYYNASLLLLVTSKYEGSMNSIKEALSCNLPVISTDVGDARKNIEQVINCFICNYNADQMIEKIKFVIENKISSNGRGKIFELRLDDEHTNYKIVKVYEQVLWKNIS